MRLWPLSQAIVCLRELLSKSHFLLLVGMDVMSLVRSVGGPVVAILVAFGSLAPAAHGQVDGEAAQWESTARESLRRVAAERQRLLAAGDHRGAELLDQVLQTLEETLEDNRSREVLPPPLPVNPLAATGPVLLAANAQDEGVAEPGPLAGAVRSARHSEQRRDNAPRLEQLERDVAELKRNVARLQRGSEVRQESQEKATGRDQRRNVDRLRAQLRRLDEQLAQSQRELTQVNERIEDLSSKRRRVRQELESLRDDQSTARRQAEERGPTWEEPMRRRDRRGRGN